MNGRRRRKRGSVFQNGGHGLSFDLLMRNAFTIP
jgi:hypothetical protein